MPKKTDGIAYAVLGTLLTLTTAGGAVVGVLSLQNLQAKDKKIGALEHKLETTQNDLDGVLDSLDETKLALDAQEEQTALCAEQAKHYWTSAIRLGDAFVEYIDYYPWSPLDLSKAEAERDAGDDISGCYERTGNE